ncbi:MAG TPA: transporter substrate-binding domain-containing protein [Actinomycetales bacterium]|nr:transporter substrate-binding domain-containing protein [Actinomycetales bacterium]
MSGRRTTLSVLFSGALVLGLAACGPGQESGTTPAPDGTPANGEGTEASAGGTLARIQEAGSITVGFAGEAPYSYEDGGELTGATVALHRAVFAELGIDDVQGVLTDWDALIPGLNAERFDAVSAGMSILPERCAQAAFSDPEFMYTTALMVPEGNPAGLSTLDDVVDSDVRLATMSGAIESSYADSLGIDSLSVQTPQDGFDAMLSGRADAFSLTAISLNYMLDNNPGSGFEVTESFVQEIDGVPQVGAGGTVFRQGDDELLAEYNRVLGEIVADEDRYLEIVGPFGFTAGERPDGSLTTEQLCAGDI